MPNCKTDCYFAFGGPQGEDSLAAPGESSNESAGEMLDVEGVDNSGGAGGLGLGVAARGQQAAEAAAASGGGATTPGQKPSRGIGIGIGVAAGAATVHRGMKRELSDSNLGGAADWDGNDSAWAGMGGDARRSMSEQQKLERRVRVLWCSGMRGFALCFSSSAQPIRIARATYSGLPTYLALSIIYDTPLFVSTSPSGKNVTGMSLFERITAATCRMGEVGKVPVRFAPVVAVRVQCHPRT